MTKNYSAGSLAFGNHSAGSLAFGSGNQSADILGFASGVGGFECKRGGRSARSTRDFVASPNE